VGRILHRHVRSPLSDSQCSSRPARRLRRSERPRQLARTVTAQKPFDSPLSGCSRNPGRSISLMVAVASSRERISRNFATWSTNTPRGSSSSQSRFRVSSVDTWEQTPPGTASLETEQPIPVFKQEALTRPQEMRRAATGFLGLVPVARHASLLQGAVASCFGDQDSIELSLAR
jgi:hypothetical protein